MASKKVTSPELKIRYQVYFEGYEDPLLVDAFTKWEAILFAREYKRLWNISASIERVV